MPEYASRITLEVTDVRVQRAQDISEEDAVAEGAYPFSPDAGGGFKFARGEQEYDTAREAFTALWESIYGPYAWARNDWVWAITFRRVDAGPMTEKAA